MQIDLDLTSYLQFHSGATVEQNKISETQPLVAVFFQRRPSNQDLFLDGSAGLYDTNFDVEIYGTDIDAVESLADSLKTLLHGFAGHMGFTYVYSIFVSDHEEDYTSKVELNTDAGLHVSTFALEISH
jgi:hypothetical protein